MYSNNCFILKPYAVKLQMSARASFLESVKNMILLQCFLNTTVNVSLIFNNHRLFQTPLSNCYWQHINLIVPYTYCQDIVYVDTATTYIIQEFNDITAYTATSYIAPILIKICDNFTNLG